MANFVQCNAKSKRTGERCKARAVIGAQVCYHHGGRTPKGVASPNFKHGRHSKYLPADLMGRYGEAVEDTELLNMRSEIALMDVLIAENLSALQTGESAEFWDAALDQVINSRRAYKSENYALLEQSLDVLEALCDERRLHFAAEKEIRDKVDQRRKLVESEQKRLVNMQQMVTSEQAMLLMSALLDAVRRNVRDRGILAAVQAEFIRLTTQPNHQRIDAGNADSE
jgi:hypothetical protein